MDKTEREIYKYIVRVKRERGREMEQETGKE